LKNKKSRNFCFSVNVLLKTSRNISEKFCHVFTSEDGDADRTGQNECCFVFCVVVLTDTWFYILVVKAIFYSLAALIHKVLFALLEIECIS
jgi:hypothetical protein